MLTVGWPAALEQLMLRGGQVAYARVISGLGTTIFAAHQIGFNILNLTFQPGTAFAIAATTIVGQKLGAGDPDGAEKGAKEAQFEGLVTAAIMAAVFVFFGRNLAGYTVTTRRLLPTLPMYSGCTPWRCRSRARSSSWLAA
jgi:Na+-driven multidrug efflux pump